MYNCKSKYFLQIKVKFAQLKVSLEQLSSRCTRVYMYNEILHLLAFGSYRELVKLSFVVAILLLLLLLLLLFFF